MKTLRYLLMVVAMVSVLGVYAQGLATKPEAQMQSTSVMVGSGSALPQAAATGVYVTGSTPASYSPTRVHPGHIRKDVGEEGTEDEDDPDNPGEPNPIGDGLWPLILAAAVYGVYRRKRSV